MVESSEMRRIMSKQVGRTPHETGMSRQMGMSPQGGGHLYTQTNETQNAVIHFHRNRTARSRKWTVPRLAARVPACSDQFGLRGVYRHPYVA